MPMPPEFERDNWSSILAPKVLPLLVWCAEQSRPITYQELDDEVFQRGWWPKRNRRLTNYGHVAGVIGFAIADTADETGQDIPPLNAIVVNKHTTVPGKGCDYFLTRYLTPHNIRDALTRNQRRRLGTKCLEEVFAYTRWRRLLRRYGLKPLGHGMEDPPIGQESFELPGRPRGGGGGEGEPHRRLVNYVKSHPACVKVAHRFDCGKKEQWLSSGDRIDVLFENSMSLLGVECKSFRSNDDDLTRGLFQCIKYREVLRAMERATARHRTVNCYLAVQRYLSPELQRLAALLDVQWFVVRSQGW